MEIIEYPHGDVEYRVNGILHRTNGPAEVFKNNRYNLWWLYGKRHRYYGKVEFYGEWWYIHGELVE